MLSKSKWNMDLLGEKRQAGREQLGRKPSIQWLQGQTEAWRESLNASKRVVTSRSSVSLKKKITSCQTNWVTFMMELVTE